MRIKIQKWGNSLALRIPKAFAFESNIRENEFVNLTFDAKKIIIETDVEKKYTLEELISGINKSNLHKEVDSGNKIGAENW